MVTLFTALLPLLLFTVPTTAARPNIILFLLDDLGWSDTGYQGAEYSTPTIDRLAQEGIRLKQYYVQPLCSPSRAALLAGRYSYNLGLADRVITNGLPFGLGLEEVTFMEHLRRGGYTTHAVGKWDLGMHTWEYTPTYRGFDTFYGFYNAEEDHFTHEAASVLFPDPDSPGKMHRTRGLDLRSNKEAVTTEKGTYSTNLYTRVIQDAITSYTEDQKPFFIYGAYQAPHDPLQVPEKYLENCRGIPYHKRRVFCGMMQALDEGISNITETLEAKRLIDNTVIILTTDNGGQTATGSRNWPLRGNKATVFEGGVRGVGFVWGKMLSKTDFDYTGLMHITDWYRTIVEGIAGLKLGESETKGLDGMNMWQGITENEPSGRKEILLQLNPPSYANLHYLYIGQAAIRLGEWKLIVGKPNCKARWNIKCPIGWVHLNGTIEQSPDDLSDTQLWLYNLTSDPYERKNVASLHPDIVSELSERLEFYNSTHIRQISPPFDPMSDPKYFDGIWTPWIDVDDDKRQYSSRKVEL